MYPQTSLPTSQPGSRTTGQLQQHRSTRPLRYENLWTTLLGQFGISGALIVLLALIQTWTSWSMLTQATHALHTIQQDSTPSIDAGLAMAQAIEDIDAKASDYLGTVGLNENQPCSLPFGGPPVQLTPHDCADQTIDQELVVFNRALYVAAHNVSYPGERTAIARTLAGMQAYSGQIALMRDAYRRAAVKTDPADPNMQAARAAARAATTILRDQISLTSGAQSDEEHVPDCVLPEHTIAANTWPQGGLAQNIACLTTINKGYLDIASVQINDQLANWQGQVNLLAMLLSVALVITTWRMATITHRVINLGLTIAVVVGIGASMHVAQQINTLAGPQGSFKTLVRDSYESIYATAELRRVSTTANAAESRWLLAHLDHDQASLQRWQSDWDVNNALVTRYIDRARANATFPEERPPLIRIQKDWKTYTLLDENLRAGISEQPNAILAAEQLSTGRSNSAFSVFLTTVDNLSAVNRSYFTQISTQTAVDLERTTWISLIAFPLVALAAVAGIAQRMPNF